MEQATLVRPSTESNGLGLAGFIVSLIGLIGSGGILCPVGLIMSVIALGRQPRGFAIAGVIIGGLGTCGGLLVMVLFGGMVLAALGLAAAAFALADPQRNEMTADFVQAAAMVEQYRDANGSLPGDLEEAGVRTEHMTDPWGRIYAFRAAPGSDVGYDIISKGADGILDTDDDCSLSGIGKMWLSENASVSVTGGDQGNVRVTFGDTIIEVDEESDSVVVTTEGENGAKVIEIGDDSAAAEAGAGPGDGTE